MQIIVRHWAGAGLSSKVKAKRKLGVRLWDTAAAGLAAQAHFRPAPNHLPDPKLDKLALS